MGPGEALAEAMRDFFTHRMLCAGGSEVFVGLRELRPSGPVAGDGHFVR